MLVEIQPRILSAVDPGDHLSPLAQPVDVGIAAWLKSTSNPTHYTPVPIDVHPMGLSASLFMNGGINKRYPGYRTAVNGIGITHSVTGGKYDNATGAEITIDDLCGPFDDLNKGAYPPKDCWVGHGTQGPYLITDANGVSTRPDIDANGQVITSDGSKKDAVQVVRDFIAQNSGTSSAEATQVTTQVTIPTATAVPQSLSESDNPQFTGFHSYVDYMKWKLAKDKKDLKTFEDELIASFKVIGTLVGAAIVCKTGWALIRAAFKPLPGSESQVPPWWKM